MGEAGKGKAEVPLWAGCNGYKLQDSGLECIGCPEELDPGMTSSDSQLKIKLGL